MKKWYHILWGSKEEEELVKQQVEKSPDPADLTIENAYKTRWIWYHTILGLLMLMANMIMLAIFLLLAIKL
tara:strand:- start:188 stop:400 length:213 start_codon:yes stop_codon:yes gene_type:complete